MTIKKNWKVGWRGYGVREALGFTWTNEQVHDIADEMMALELLTQPADGFYEAKPDPMEVQEPVAPEEFKVTSRKEEIDALQGDGEDGVSEEKG